MLKKESLWAAAAEFPSKKKRKLPGGEGSCMEWLPSSWRGLDMEVRRRAKVQISMITNIIAKMENWLFVVLKR